MSANDAYRVVTTGQILDGFDVEDVKKHLVSVLRLKPEQADIFFAQPRVLRKDISWANADEICSQLARLGVAAKIQENTASPASQPERSLHEEPSLELVEEEAKAQAATHEFACPNCQHPQDKSEQCESCGIWFHKFESAATTAQPKTTRRATPAAAMQAVDSTVVSSEDVIEEGALSPIAIIAAVVAALIGAFVWRLIAVTFGYEFGLIAWGIGGAVGFAAASAGSRGMVAGVVCAVLAFGSIGLGKYWAYSAFIGEFQEALTEVMESEDDMFDYFEQEMEDARLLVSGSGSDIFIRRFMVERNYTDASDPAQVSAEEVAFFREYTEPELRDLAENSPEFEEWQSGGVASIGEFSPWAMMREDLGILDILFLLLGIGTAFRLGSQMD